MSTDAAAVGGDSAMHDALPADGPPAGVPERRRNPGLTTNVINRFGPMAAEAGHMGLTGVWKTVGNVTAVAFVFGMAYLMYRDMASGQKEDRLLFREEMRLQREAYSKAQDGQAAEMRALSTEIRAAVSEMRSAREAITRTEKAVTTAVAPKE